MKIPFDIKIHRSTVAPCFGLPEHNQLKEMMMARAKPLWLQLKQKTSKKTLDELRKTHSEQSLDAAFRFFIKIAKAVIREHSKKIKRKRKKTHMKKAGKRK